MDRLIIFVTPCRFNPIASQAKPFVEYLSCFTHSDFLNVARPSFDDLCRKQRKKSKFGYVCSVCTAGKAATLAVRYTSYDNPTGRTITVLIVCYLSYDNCAVWRCFHISLNTEKNYKDLFCYKNHKKISKQNCFKRPWLW